MSGDALVYRFNADTSGLKSGLNDVKSQLASIGAAARAQGQNISSGLDAASAGMEKLKNAAAVATLGMSTLATVAAAALIGVGARVIALGDAVRTAAGAFNQSVTTMGEVKAVADRSGASLNDIGKAFQNIQSKAASGDDTITHALTAIGLSASSVAGLTQRELGIKFAETFASMKDSTNKAAVGVALFGSDLAGKLIPQLDRGAASLGDIMDAAHRAGAVIGPEMSTAIAGTAEVWQKFHDRVAELKMVFEGLTLQTFAKTKGAIDGLMASFTDLIGNITALIEWFKGVSGAGEGSAKSLGFLRDAANWLAAAIAGATVSIEEFAARGAANLHLLGVSFDGLASIVKAFGEDLSSMAKISATNLYNAMAEAIHGVIALFGDLADAGKKALTFDFSGVKAAFLQFASDAAGVSGKIAAALVPSGMSATKQAWADAQKAAGDQQKNLDAIIAKLEAQKKAQLDLIAAGGAQGKSGKLNAGDPTVPAKDTTKDAKTAVERYIDSLSKANKTAQAENQTWAATNVEREKAVALAQLTAAAEKDGVAATEEQKQKVTQLATQMQVWKDKTQALKEMAQGLSDTFANALDQLIVKGGKFNDVMKQVLVTLESAALKAALTGDGMFGGLFGGAAGSGGALGSLFKPLVNAVSSFSGFKAQGGPVMGGKAYVVGERGPELFQPNGGGNIIPNGAQAPANGNAPAPVVVHFNLPAGTNADSFRQSEGQITAMMARAVSRGQRYT